MRISISGSGECGKDTAAVWLGQNTSLRYQGSTSYCAAEMVFLRMRELGRTYNTVQDCYNDRRNCRDLWVKLIDEINQDDKAYLYKFCLSIQDILTGVRRAEELQAVKDCCNIDLFIWIDRPGYNSDPTQMYGPELCDITILNDGNLAQFYKKLKHLSKALGIYGRS